MKNPWTEFKHTSFELVDLGRPAVFLIPTKKLSQKIDEKTARDHISEFLVQHFSAYTTAIVPHFGIWRDGNAHLVEDTCTLYEVSFKGREKIALLIEYLANLCIAIDEECLYFKAGEDTCLINPTRT